MKKCIDHLPLQLVRDAPDHAEIKHRQPPIRHHQEIPRMRVGMKEVERKYRASRGLGGRARVLIDGPSSDHDLVLKARLATQAPDIDASVFLTDCDPSAFRPGDFTDVEIVDAQGYDLVARPLS